MHEFKPMINNEIFKKKEKNNIILFNYKKPSGILVIDKKVLKILKMCNGTNNTDKISKYLKIKEDTLVNILKLLQHYNIIDLNDNKEINKDKKIKCWIHLTNNCNLNCRYCYINKNETEMNEETAIKTVNKIIEMYEKEKYEEVLLTFAGGEPFLKFDLIQKIIKYIKEKTKLNVSYRILTNGTILTKQHISFIKENNIDIRISLDGIEQYNDKNRYYQNGKGTYKKVIETINILKENQITPTINVVVTIENLKGLTKLTKELINLNVPFRFSLEKSNNNTIPELTKNQNKLIKELKKIFKIIEKETKTKNIDFQIDDIKFNNNTGLNCKVGVNIFAINQYGEIALCGMDLNNPMGKIEEKITIKDILKRNDIAKKHKSQECEKCKFNKICNNGCPLFNKSCNVEKNLYCKTYKKIIPKLLKMQIKKQQRMAKL